MFSNKLINLCSSPAVAVLTGAGMSAESGVPTFRGEDGIWNKLNPEELANFDAFMKNPELVWEWYLHRQKIIMEIEPNSGHYALAELEKVCQQFYLITQNVDGLHMRAGSSKPIELHGNIMRNRCLNCGEIYTEIELIENKKIPRCVECDGMLRPDVVWFGENLPQKALSEADEAINSAEIFLSVGTSAQVQPAASMPLWAKSRGAYIVEINIEETHLTPYADEFILGKSGVILPELLKSIYHKH